MPKYNELKFIEEFKKLPQGKTVKVGPGDDCAVIEEKKKYLLFCGDMLIENVHFKLGKVRFKDLGYRALARSLSDIASMGGYPKYAGLSLALPLKYSSKVEEILKGVVELSKSFGFSLVGGDLSRAERVFLDAWCIGYVEKENLTLRSKAKDRDGLFLTGPLGASFYKKFRFFPRIREGRWLVKHCKINSMIDVSDGLVLDLYRLLSESKKEAVLFKEAIPFYKGASLEEALYGGEDYELLFTAPLREKEKILSKGFYLIGEIKDSSQVRIFLRDSRGRLSLLKIKGYFSL